MNRIILLLAAFLATGTLCAQEAYRAQRRALFEALPVGRGDIVFVGNSITDNCEWAELFADRRVKNRGIGTDRAQWLAERIDPIAAGHPRKLFLMIGTNDLAQGAAPAAASVGSTTARLLRPTQEKSWMHKTECCPAILRSN